MNTTGLNLGPGVSRRDFVSRLGAGFGSVALGQLLASDNASRLDPQAGGHRPHHRPRAKRVIQLFMNGGASQMDLFDHKPELFRRAGQPFDPGSSVRIEAPTSEPGKVLKPPVPLRQHGQSGRWVSDLMPNLARCVDDIAFLMAMQSRTNVHGPASYLMNTGSLLPGFPAFGAWVGYALGSEADNLPGFVVLPDTKGLPYNQRGNFSAGFLPVAHQGTLIHAGNPSPMAYLKPPASALSVTPEASREGLTLLQQWNRRHLEANDSDPRLEARIQAYELAARMQLSAPEAFDLSVESPATRRLYGMDRPESEEFGRRCLMARRLVERGVRFVQVWSGTGGPTGNWDNHANMAKELPPMCASTDLPIAGLLQDLRSCGLLEDTLVLWNTEFGRMPFAQSSEGRDHNGGTFVGWMAGAGVRPGVSYGQSDEWSWKAARDITTTYDFHATALHLLGLNHERLNVLHQGANRRLTDVHGEVIRAVLA